jgi:late competence protein required for DNA uptake (superfamily II DNA/RNA helicase)
MLAGAKVTTAVLYCRCCLLLDKVKTYARKQGTGAYKHEWAPANVDVFAGQVRAKIIS